MEREWKLGKDLHETANILDPLTFDTLILAVSQNERITKDTVKKELKVALDIAFQDMEFLIEKNMAEIIRRAKGGAYN